MRGPGTTRRARGPKARVRGPVTTHHVRLKRASADRSAGEISRAGGRCAPAVRRGARAELAVATVRRHLGAASVRHVSRGARSRTRRRRSCADVAFRRLFGRCRHRHSARHRGPNRRHRHSARHRRPTRRHRPRPTHCGHSRRRHRTRHGPSRDPSRSREHRSSAGHRRRRHERPTPPRDSGDADGPCRLPAHPSPVAADRMRRTEPPRSAADHRVRAPASDAHRPALS